MNYSVCFEDKRIGFTRTAPSPEPGVAVLEGGVPLSIAKVLQIVENNKELRIISSDPGRDFDAFCNLFARVEAAGGLVTDAGGRVLLIFRNGRWDLPKGHLECGERIEACAVREIVEETGVCAEPVRPLCRTWHAYYFPKTERWELKRTHWYELRAVACGDLVPQTEEGIETVVWCTPAEAMAHAAGSFPTVRAVLERLEACLSDDKKR